MNIHYSESQIFALIDTLLNHQNGRFPEEGIEQLKNLEKCSNFIEEFLLLALHPNLNENQKNFTLQLIRLHFNRYPQICIDFNLINIIFGIFNNVEVGNEYKKRLVNLMCLCQSFIKMRENIANLVLYKQANGQLREGDLFVVYISQYILKEGSQWINQINFITQMSHFFYAFSRIIVSSIQQGNQQQQILLEMLEVFKMIDSKLKDITLEQQLEYINGQMTDILHQILRFPFHTNHFIIKAKSFDLLKNLLVKTCDYLNKQVQEVKSIIYLPQSISEALTFLYQINNHEEGSEGSASLESCLKFILAAYDLTRFYPMLIFPQEQIFSCLLNIITMKKLHYDNYYYNPHDFIFFIHQLLQPNTIKPKILQQSQGKEKKEDGFDCLRRYDVGHSIYVSTHQQSKTQLEEKMNAYRCVALLMEKICQRNQMLSCCLIGKVFDVLFQQEQIQGLERTNCLIILGLMKGEILKRSEMLNHVERFLLKQLETSPIPTTHTEQPESIHAITTDIQFFIVIAIAERYLTEIFEDNRQNSQLLLSIIFKIIQTRKTECSLVVLSIQILESFTPRIEYSLDIISIVRARLLWSQSNIISDQLLEVYRQLLANMLPRNIFNINNAFYSAIIDLFKLIHIWERQQKTFSGCFKALDLLFEYKSYLLACEQSEQGRNTSNLILNHLIAARATLEIPDTVIAFDKHFLQSIVATLEQGYRLEYYPELQYQTLISIMDKYIRKFHNSLYQQFTKIIKLLFVKLGVVTQDIMKRLPELLKLLLAGDKIQQKHLYSSVILAVSSIMVNFQKLDSDRIIELCKVIEFNYLNEESLNTLLAAIRLIIKTILYLQDSLSDVEFQDTVMMNRNVLNCNAWSNQISLYLFSSLIHKFAQLGKMENVSSLLGTTINLADSNMKQSFYDPIFEDEEPSCNKAGCVKISIDQWSVFRSSIALLRSCGQLEIIRCKMSTNDEQILRRAFLCENIAHKTRMIVKTK